MTALLFAITVLFAIALSFAIKKSNKNEAKEKNEFWQNEHDANFSRKRSLDNLNTIKIPKSIIELVNTVKDKETYTDNAQTICDLEDKGIYNLNGISNTNVKLEYGAANMSVLSEYDDNYASLIKALDQIGIAFFEDEIYEDSKAILEYATEIGTDILSSYTTLANIYIKLNTPELIHILIKKAEALKSFRGPAIVRSLKAIQDQ